jgi:hypothetical protein
MCAVGVIVERRNISDDILHDMEMVFHSKWILRFFCSLVSSEWWSGIVGFGLRLFLNEEQAFDRGGYVGDNRLVHSV